MITGDIANFIAKLAPIKEQTFLFKNQYLVDENTQEGSLDKELRKVEVPGLGQMPLFDFIYQTNPAAAQNKLPTTVLFEILSPICISVLAYRPAFPRDFYRPAMSDGALTYRFATYLSEPSMLFINSLLPFL